MTEPVRDAEAVFLAALDRETPHERAAYVEQACAGDPELLRRVRELLDCHEGPPGPLDAPSVGRSNVVDLAPLAEGPGTVIGPYKLLETIGEGGMGTVFLAEQTQPLHRVVAVKVIKPGMDSRQVIARFEAERQALALMDHPNIATVLDAGTTDSGRPYFVMELVQGVPITSFCDLRRLTLRERLELFVSVCSAVQHAHQKGVIHRDLKPSNILVALYDGRPVVKVIDFGVAKATGQRLTEKTLFTGFGAVVGTPAYMSPEQAELNQLDIDTRSDIYSLGVVLYELLTGTTPLDRKRLKQVDLLEVLRLIREEEPPTPSTRLDSTDELAAIAANRRLEPRKLSGLVRGELDWIVMKCLEKDRSRRYETANGLAMDLRRYLADEAVQACPPSAGYRLRKFARRNKRALATAALAGVMLLAAAAGALVYAAKQQRLAEEQKGLAEERNRFAAEKEESQRRTQEDLYQALIRHSAALREGRQPGYRARVWANLRQAAGLPACKPEDIRREVLACLGDPVSLEPVGAGSARRAVPPEIPERLRAWVPKSPNHHAAVAPGGKLLAVTEADRVVLRGEDGKVLASATRPLGSVYDLRFTSDGRSLVGGCEEGVAVWTVHDLRLSTFYRGHNAYSVAVQPGGPLIASTGFTITLWSLRSNRPVAILKQPSAAARVEFSADGKLLLAVERDRVLAAWAVGDTPEKLDLAGHDGAVPTVAFSPDGKLLASAGKDRKVKVWDARSGALLHTGDGHEAVIESVAFSHDGALLASGDFQGTIRLWDPRTGEAVGRINAASASGKTWRLQFDASGRYLAAAGHRGVGAWAIRRGNGKVTAEEFLALPGEGSVYDLAIHPGGTGLVWLHPSGRLAAHDLTQGRPLPVSVRSQSLLRTLHFDPAGSQVRFVTLYGRLGAMSWPGGQPAWAPDLKVGMLAGGPDGRWLATLDLAGRVIVYDLEAGREWATLPPQAAEMWALSWSPDGTRLAAGLTDGGVVIWDLGQVRARLAEFGIELPSTAARPAVPRARPLSDAEFKRIVQVNRASAVNRVAPDGDPDRRESLRLMALSRAVREPTADPYRAALARAALHAALGRWDRTAADCAGAVKAAPDRFSAWHAHAVACLAAGDVDGYRKVCAGILDRFEKGEDVRSAASAAFACVLAPGASEDPNRVVRMAERVVGSRRSYLAMTSLGAALYRAGRFDAAVRRLEAAAGSHGKEGMAWDGLFRAMAHQRQGRGEQARRCLDEAVRWIDQAEAETIQDPRVRIPLSWQQRLELRTLRREAEELVTGKLDLSPAEPPVGWQVSFARAQAHDALSEWPEAAAGYREAIRLRPEVPAAHNKLAWLLATCPDAELRDPKRAVEHARQAVALAPKHGDYWNTLGVAHYRAGEWTEAITALQKYRELRTGDDEYSNAFVLAMAHWRLGKKDEARRWYDRAVEWMEKKQPKNETLRRFRAEAAALLKIDSPETKPESK